MMVEICSYLRVEDVANLEQTCKQINSEIERTYIWKKQAKMLLRKFQFTFLHKAAQEFSGQHNENNVKHFSKWIISILLITHNAFKEVKWCSFWEEKFCDPDFDVSYCDDDWTFENHARVVASYHTTWALRISRAMPFLLWMKRMMNVIPTLLIYPYLPISTDYMLLGWRNMFKSKMLYLKLNKTFCGQHYNIKDDNHNDLIVMFIKYIYICGLWKWLPT